MRTSERRFARGLKNLAVILFVATLSVACGKNNTKKKQCIIVVSGMLWHYPLLFFYEL